MDFKIKYTDKKCNKVKITYKRNEIIEFLHTLHDNCKEHWKYGLYDIEENTRNVNLIFEFPNYINDFKSVVDYTDSLYNEYLAAKIKLKMRNKLEEEMK